MFNRVIILFIVICGFLFGKSVEEFPFIGVSITTETIDINHHENEKETTASLRYGKQTLEWRTMFTYEMSGNYRSFALEIDKILMDDLLGNPEYRPYAGFVLGTLHYENDDLKDESGYYYGASLGLIVYATDTMDLDLSYHYYKVEEFENLDTLHGATAALHYFY